MYLQSHLVQRVGTGLVVFKKGTEMVPASSQFVPCFYQGYTGKVALSKSHP
jgi:hypothetical protein